MSPIVLDASVALRWLLDREQSPAVIRIRTRLQSGLAIAFVPALWYWEMTNGIAFHERRGLLTRAGADAAWAALANLCTHIDADAATGLPEVAFALARQHGLTAYDAAYLELALRRQLPLATLDRQLQRVAERLGVALEV